MIKVVKKWYENDKRKLIELYLLGYTFPEIGVKMDRSRFAVESEMRLLRLQGRVGYRTIESEAAAHEKGLFKIDSVEFEDNGIMVPLSANDEETEGTEQAERAERKAITTENQMIDINFSDLKSINTYLFMLIVKNAAGYYAQRTKSQIVTIFGKNFWICESKKQTFPDKCKECYLNIFCNSSLKVNSRPNAESWCAFDAKHVIKYKNDCPDSIRDAMTAKSARTNTIFNEILENIRYTHDKKNDDYKDSYSDTMKRFGTKSGLVRIYDKFNRIENILDSEGKANFESAEDNLQDLATYAIMMLEYIKKGGNK
jgi:hypothetical protein